MSYDPTAAGSIAADTTAEEPPALPGAATVGSAPCPAAGWLHGLAARPPQAEARWSGSDAPSLGGIGDRDRPSRWKAYAVETRAMW